MLKRFHNKHNTSSNQNNNITYAQIRKNNRQKQENYYQRHHLQQQQTYIANEIPFTLQCFKTQQFLFQGILKGHKKMGEGVLMFKNGTLVVGKWTDNLLHGRAMIFTPFGGRILANFNFGKLNGWLLSFYQDQVIRCTLYYQNQIDGERLTFDEKQKMWVATKCASDGRIISIIHAERGKSSQLPSFVQSQELKDLLDRYVVNRQKFLQTEVIQELDITMNTNYIGFVDEQSRPCGLGCVYGKKQFYCGNYFEGVLQHYGRMLFQSGDIYHGQLIAGSFWGRGTYYSPSKNGTSLIFSDATEQFIQEQFVGYVLIDMIPPIGTFSQDKESGIKGDAFKKIVQDLQPYYLKEFVSCKKEQRKESMNSLYGHSQQFNIEVKGEKVQTKEKNKNYTQKQHESEVMPQKWLNFPPEQLKDLALKKTHSLDKREAAARKKSGFDINVDHNKNKANEYQTTQIKQNSNELESENYQKNMPMKTKLMQQIPFGKSQVRSLGVQLLGGAYSKQEDGSENKFREKQSMPKVIQSNLEQSGCSSVISNSSKKVELILDKTKTNRKKIFY